MSSDKPTVGSLMQHLKHYNESQTLESLLDQDEFTSVFSDIYTSLSTDSKRTAKKVFRKTNRTKKRTKSPALLRVIGFRDIDIALPPDIHNQFRIWKVNPSQFWQPFEGQHSELSIESAIVEAYLKIQNLRLREAYDVVLWRFYVSFFYHLASWLGQGQKVITSNLHNVLYQRLINIFTQSKRITDDSNIIRTKLQAWVAVGSRYNRICMALNKGALILIPHISDDMWENPNALKGAEFDEAMAHLRSIGVTRLSNQLGADVVANQIINAALDLFRWDITVEPKTFSTISNTYTAGLSIDPSIYPIRPSIDSKISTTGPSMESEIIPIPTSIEPAISTTSPSTETTTSTTNSFIEQRVEGSSFKPSSIYSLLNPPELISRKRKRTNSLTINSIIS